MSDEAGSHSWNARTTADEILANHDLAGKLIVITGGSGGIGLAAAQAFARAGADVVIGGRKPTKVEGAAQAIAACSRGGLVIAHELDLMAQASVCRFAGQIGALDRPVDVFLANAGIVDPLERSLEGIEGGFVTSYVGHAILASELQEQLTRRGGSRVVTVSSFGHHFSPIVFDDINFKRREYRPFLSYGQSKTASILLAVTLANSWRENGVDAFSLHPGTIVTEVARSLRREDFREAKQRGAVTPADQIKSLEQGAATSVWASIEPSLRGRGPLYLEDCQVARVNDEPNLRSGVMQYAMDQENAKRLWASIEQMFGRVIPL